MQTDKNELFKLLKQKVVSLQTKENEMSVLEVLDIINQIIRNYE